MNTSYCVNCCETFIVLLFVDILIDQVEKKDIKFLKTINNKLYK